MAYFLLSTGFFLSLLLSDYFQIRQKKVFVLIFSILGYAGIVALLFKMTINFWNPSELTVFFLLNSLWLIFNLLLLMYLLFFEIPFSSQYIKTDERLVVNQGSYGIVRHPAFYPFLFVTIALSLLIKDWRFGYIIIYMNFLNFLLITVEDIFLFPRIFTNYSEYKEEVPFLFPNLKNKVKNV